MRILAITHKGMENVCAQEVKNAQIIEAGVIFETENAIEYCYRTRTATKVI